MKKIKFINESIEDILKPKEEDEIQKIINETGQAPASYILKILNSERGYEFKCNFTGAWDRFGPIKNAQIIQINRGKGFEDCVWVESPDGSFIYMPPFKISDLPSEKTMFLFYADDGIYLDNVGFKKLK